MKKYLEEKLKNAKDWIVNEKWFLMLLSFMSVMLFVSMFTKYALIAVFLVMIVCGVLFNFEKSLSLFLFCYAFEAIFYFYVIKDDDYIFLFTLFYSILFTVCFVKYFISILKKQRKINLKTLIPLLIFIVYILIPINKIKFDDLIKYVIAFGFIYLLLELKDEVNVNNIIIIICVSLILSCVFSLFIRYSNRMIDIMGGYFNYGIKKRQGVFSNPNWLAVYSSLVIACLIYKLIFEDFIFIIPLCVIIPYTYGTLSRDYILCFMITLLFCVVLLCFKRKKINLIRFSASIFLILTVVFSQLEITKIYVKRLDSFYREACSLIGIERNDETKPTETPSVNKNENQGTIKPPLNGNIDNVWIDGNPIDAGRAEIWQRYLKDFRSSPKKIIFGAGASAEILGISPHNTFINLIWQFGVIGIILLSIIFYVIGREIIKSKSIFSLLIIGLVCLISLFESNVFNYVAIMMLSLIILTSKRKDMEKRYEKDFNNNSSV